MTSSLCRSGRSQTCWAARRAAVKMLASRARNRVRLVAPEELREDAGDRAVVDAFFAAAGSGDLSALLALLAPDVQLRIFTPEGVRLVSGAKKVAAQAGAGARRSAAQRPVMRPVTVRRSAGVLIVLDGRPMFVLTFTVQDGLITEMRSVDRSGPAGADRPVVGDVTVSPTATSTVRLSMAGNRRPSRESRATVTRSPRSRSRPAFVVAQACSRQPVGLGMRGKQARPV